MEDALERWRSEKTAAYLSGAVAAAERDPAKAKLFGEMAEAAEQQAAILAKDQAGPRVRAVAPVAADRLSDRHVRSARHAARAVGLEGARRLGL